MRSHHAVAHFLVAGLTGDHDSPPVYPYPHILTRHQEHVAVVTELPAEGPVDPYPLAHRDPAGNLHVPVAQRRMPVENPERLLEQYANSFLRDLFCQGIFRSHGHLKDSPASGCAYYQRHG
jgi:hypothetical protein